MDKFEESITKYTGHLCGAKNLQYVSTDAKDLDITDAEKTMAYITELKPDVIFHCAAYTYQGAVPVFIDSEPNTWNMSPVALESALEEAERNNQLPKAIIVVNLYGQMADYERILAIANQFNVPVIEDAAESLGSTYKGISSGLFGTIGIYSFNGNKIITTSGGGALVSSDKKYVEHSRFLATQARDQAPYYQHSEIGYNYRLSNISAGIGRGQMEVLNDRVAKRREIFNRYKEAFSGIDRIEMMPEVDMSLKKTEELGFVIPTWQEALAQMLEAGRIQCFTFTDARKTKTKWL
ncbi:hypothetical protein EfmAA610_09670 [Enterococcus faecium]|nr:hypothetical protein EfmAA610_09670 [Enterococcus faecium]